MDCTGDPERNGDIQQRCGYLRFRDGRDGGVSWGSNRLLRVGLLMDAGIHWSGSIQ